MLNLNTRQSN